jgi:hypothetical protein
MDPDPAIFVIGLIDANKKLVFLLFLFKGTFTSFFKCSKVKKKSQNSKNQGFAFYFSLMIEGSGSATLVWAMAMAMQCYFFFQLLKLEVKYTRL